jgi:hypothetical protein
MFGWKIERQAKVSSSQNLRSRRVAKLVQSCAKEGKNMSEVLSDLIEQYVSDRETQSSPGPK